MKRILNSKFVARYGNLFILLLLCGYYSVATLETHFPISANAARNIAQFVVGQHPGSDVVIVTPSGKLNEEFASAAEEVLSPGTNIVRTISADPGQINRQLREIGAANTRVDFIVTQHSFRERSFRELAAEFPNLEKVAVIRPRSYLWPTFLKVGNLRSIVNNIAIIAIIAIGMTLVIITGGIDLSVGSLIAFSGVVVAVVADKLAQGAEPSFALLMLASAAAMLLCAMYGVFSGVMVTRFGIPAFIVTLAVMEIARGQAFRVAGGPTPIDIASDAFHWLGGGSMLGIPNPVLIMLVLYAIAHVLMSHTALGRYIYAVGGNAEAARLSGVPVKRVLVFTYLVCGALAGLAGVLDASLFRVGRAAAGDGYELRIIAAVVVGGTSLAGGEGKILGTFIGALILSVIENGMNLTKIDPYTQKIVFGILILIAVLLDKWKSKGWKLTTE